MATFEATTDIILIRHGRTDANEKDILQGSSDWPLNNNGKEDVKSSITKLFNEELSTLLSENLHIVIASSDLIRAVSTSLIVGDTLIALGEGRITCEYLPPDYRLRERNFGLWEGQASALFQANKRKEWLAAMEQGGIATWKEAAAEGVEMDGDFLCRLVKGLNASIEAIKNLKHDKKCQLILCGHGSAFRTITSFVAGKDTGKLINGGLCRLRQADLHRLQQTLLNQGYFLA